MPPTGLGAPGAAHGGVWGFVRSMRQEFPPISTITSDISRGKESHVKLATYCEAEHAVVDTACYSARLRRHGNVKTGDQSSIGGVWVITGGLGGLGLRAASLLSLSGARRVALSSRSGLVAYIDQGLSERLVSLGPHVSVRACNVGDRAQSK